MKVNSSRLFGDRKEKCGSRSEQIAAAAAPPLPLPMAWLDVILAIVASTAIGVLVGRALRR